MSRPKVDLTNKQFTRWTVLYRGGNPDGRHQHWVCRCSCGVIREVDGHPLTTGMSRSCGCLSREKAAERCRKDPNPILYQDTEKVVIALERKGKTFACTVDAADYPKIAFYHWAYSNGYAVTGKCLKMHQLLGCKGFDHKDRNGLNNSRSNLRPTNSSLNSANSSKQKTGTSSPFKGVWLDGNRWAAMIKVKGQRFWLGRFTDPVVAAQAYDSSAIEKFGEFAATNASLGLLKKQPQSAEFSQKAGDCAA